MDIKNFNQILFLVKIVYKIIWKIIIYITFAVNINNLSIKGLRNILKLKSPALNIYNKIICIIKLNE